MAFQDALKVLLGLLESIFAYINVDFSLAKPPD